MQAFLLIYIFRFYFSPIGYFLEELQSLRESESRYKQQYAEAQRRERLLIRRLAAKEQELQDYAVISIYINKISDNSQ